MTRNNEQVKAVMQKTIREQSDTLAKGTMGVLGGTAIASVVAHSFIEQWLRPMFGGTAEYVATGSMIFVLVGGVVVAVYSYKKGLFQRIADFGWDGIGAAIERFTNVEFDNDDNDSVTIVNEQPVPQVVRPTTGNPKPQAQNTAFEDLMVKMTHYPHLYVVSTSGSGKTVVMNHWLQEYMPENGRYIVLDAKPEGVNELKWQGAIHVENDTAKFERYLKAVNALMDKRQAETQYRYPPLYLVVDEFGSLCENAPELVEQYVTRLIGKSRSANIHVVMMTQSTSANYNNISGFTDLFNKLQTFSFAFHPEFPDVRVVNRARILSNGQMKTYGEPIRIPKLPVPWMEVERPFMDDLPTWETVVAPTRPLAAHSPKQPSSDRLLHIQPNGQQMVNNGVPTREKKWAESGQNEPPTHFTDRPPQTIVSNDVNVMETAVKMLKIITQKTETELDDMAVDYVAGLASATMKIIEEGGRLSSRAIQTQALGGYTGERNKDVKAVLDYLQIGTGE